MYGTLIGRAFKNSNGRETEERRKRREEKEEKREKAFS